MNVSKSIFIKRPVEAAFRHFTADIGRWWPLKEGYSFDAARASEIVLEGRVGGRFFERYTDGEEATVGRVTAFEPPSRVVFTWKQPSWNADTEVEVRFDREGEGTRLTLEHRGFEALRDTPPKLFESYGEGWARILERFAA